MSMRNFPLIGLLLLVLLSGSELAAQSASNTSASTASARPPYWDPSLSLEQRVNDLVSRMTLEEKVSQMQDVAPAIPRLGIPAYNWWNEGLHGVARAGNATVFPQAIGLAATWDTDLVHRVAGVISTEARAKYNDANQHGNTGRYFGLTFWSPNINIFRDPRWGRGQETYGEDPYLTARMGVEFVKGLQGDDPRYLKVVATAKHFAVHSGPEPDRHHFDVHPSERDLFEPYLPAFRRLMLARLRLGMFDPPERVRHAQIPYSANQSAEHGRLARRMAQESIVLLKNDGVLPLSRGLQTVAVVGPNADEVMTLLGNYYGTPAKPVTVLAGIRSAVGP